MSTIQRLGGPTAILGYAGRRLVTDPTFDPPHDQDSSGVTLTKLTGPAVPPDDLGEIDAVLLSHDHHPDNLDEAGRAFLPRAGRVLTTEAGAARLGGHATGLAPWQTTELTAPGRPPITVTALPAQHGPDGTDHLTGPVIGFLLESGEEPRIYVSGDNASLDVVRTIAERVGPIDVAVLFAGAASIPERFDGAHLTLGADDAARAAGILGAPVVVAVHVDGWAHFSEGPDALRRSFEAAGLGDRLRLPEHGQTIAV